MPHFKNSSTSTITTDIGDERYRLEPGETAEIPARLTYVIARRGLPLVEVPLREVDEKKIVRPGPVPPPRRVKVPGVASGNTVERGAADAEDTAGERAPRELVAGDEGDGGIPVLPPAVARGAAARHAAKSS